MKIQTIISILILIFFWGCNQTPGDKTSGKKSATGIAINIPQFNADSAFNFVKAQTDFGPRVNNTEAHRKCASYLIDKLNEYSPDVVTQTGIVTAYNGTRLQFQNIIASFGHDGNNRILLGAHWDSRPYADHDPDETKHNMAIDGANDGASGVGVLLELARQMNQTHPPIGVDIIFFDAEDYGPPQDLQDNQNTGEHWGLGSQYWAANPHKTDYFAKYGILLDMVGASNATFLMEGVSMEHAPSIVKKVWDIGNQIGYSSYFLYQRGGFVTDDHYYVIRDQGIPMIDIIHLNQDTESGMYEHWHTMEDNINKIDKNTLKAVGQTMLTVIYSEK